jgi:RNA polymerase sigma-70 factor, ECF subfamily
MEKTLMGQPAARVVTDNFADLYHAHIGAVYNYCLFRVGEISVAEDLTADTFERAWRARGRYDAERSEFATWLFSIARHVVADWQRQRTRRPLVALEEQHPDHRPSPESQVEAAESTEHLRRLVLALPPHEQELVALKFGAGMTNRQIATLMDKGESAIGSALHRVMQKLRADVQRTGDGP